MRNLPIGIIQQHNTNDIHDNMLRLEQNIRRLARQGARLIVLQELHNALYFCQREDVKLFEWAEPIPGPSTDFYGRVAREEQVVIVTSLFEKRAPGLYHNTAVVIECDGTIAGKYRKMHIPDDPAYYRYFRGQTGCVGLLGPVVSRSCPADGTSGSRNTDISHSHRTGTHRSGRRTGTPATGMDHRSAGTCRG